MKCTHIMTDQAKPQRVRRYDNETELQRVRKYDNEAELQRVRRYEMRQSSRERVGMTMRRLKKRACTAR